MGNKILCNCIALRQIALKLTKIYDEDETIEGEKYRCQIYDKDYDDQKKFLRKNSLN